MRINQQILNVYVQGLPDLETLINEQAGLVEGEYAAEIRATFRGMAEKERGDTLSAALKAGDGALIAAVCLPPPVVSGVSSEMQSRYVDAIRKQKAPELIQELADLNNAMDVADAAKRVTGTMFNENYNVDEQSAIDKAEREYAEAEAALAESLD